jgi:rubrerythrin
MPDPQDFVEVYLAADPAQAEELREVLESQDVPCLLMPGGPVVPHEVRVLCPGGLVEQARTLIAAYVEPGADEPVLTCTACGKVVTDDDVECPACGEPLEGVEGEE